MSKQTEGQLLVRTLTSDDHERIAAVLDRMPIADHAKQVDHLVGTWAWFVVEVEKGYDDNIYDYLNDVSVRRILDRLLHAVPPDTSGRLADLLEPFDKRFIAATIPVDRHLGTGIIHLDYPPRLSEHPDPAGESYYTRVPRNPSEELAADLRESGL